MPISRNSPSAEREAADDLRRRGDQDDVAGADDLLQVDLQPDHEQHEDQSELGDGVDRLLGLHPFEPGRAEQEAGDEIGQDQRLAREIGGDAQQPRHDDGQREVVDQLAFIPRLMACRAAAKLLSPAERLSSIDHRICITRRRRRSSHVARYRLPFATAEATANLISASVNGLAMTSQISASSPDARSRWSA